LQFEVHGGDLTDRVVQATTVVPVLDPSTDRDPGCLLGRPHTPVVELSLERRKKDSAMALSQQMPVYPMDLISPFAAANAVICADAYWADSTGRRNTSTE